MRFSGLAFSLHALVGVGFRTAKYAEKPNGRCPLYAISFPLRNLCGGNSKQTAQNQAVDPLLLFGMERATP